jgi:arylsulfatase A-like enzyme
MRRIALVWLLILAGHVSAADRQPNIVLIFADDVGYGDLGCYGATKARTPHIDQLARQGRRFTDYHSVSAVCTPSRYALLTGEYPFRIDSFAPVFGRTGLLIDPKKITIASMLRSRGYATACFGKWHLGLGEQTPDWNGQLKPGPLEVGFDHYFGQPTVSSHSPFVWVEDHRVLGLDPSDPLVHGGKPVTREFPEKIVTGNTAMSGAKAAHALYDDEQLGATLSERAIAWMHSRSNRTFFLYFATPHIHHPFTPHPRFKGSSDCGPYGDYLHELDWMVGRIMATLDELKLAEHTLILFTSDNGGMLNEGGKQAWRAGHRLNGDLLGFKFGAWEGGHRVPMVARWPGRIPAGSVSDRLFAHVDLLATFAALVGATLPGDQAVDSYNALEALVGEPIQPVRDHLVVAAFNRKHLALRRDQWVYIGAQGSGGFGNGLRELAFSGQVNTDVDEQGNLKPGSPSEQLYDLRSDPRQAANVIRQHPDVAEQMKSQLAAIRTSHRTAPPR